MFARSGFVLLQLVALCVLASCSKEDAASDRAQAGAGASVDLATPQPLALAGFPVDSSVIEAWIHNPAGPDTVAIRAHAWALFAAVTAMTGEPTGGGARPVYETWTTRFELFDAGIIGGRADLRTTAKGQGARGLHQPAQFTHDALAATGAALGSDAPTVASVRYNSEAAAHIRRYRYNDSTVLRALNDSFPSSTPVGERNIVPFPRSAAVVKAAYWMIKREGLTMMPYWAGPRASTNSAEPSPDTWTQWVAVDPTGRQAGDTISVTRDGRSHRVAVVGLDSFYSFPLDSAEVAAIKLVLQGNQALAIDVDGALSPDSVVAGDHVALVAMHVVTKEIRPWTWQTFWWTPDPARDPLANDAPGSVAGPFRYFAMSAAYYAVVPRGPAAGREHVSFNPYLETEMPMGVRSNCMSCHHTAAWPTNEYVFTGKVRPDDSRLFAGKLKLDFLWSIQLGDSLQQAARTSAPR